MIKQSIQRSSDMLTQIFYMLWDRGKILYNSIANPEIRHKVWTKHNIILLSTYMSVGCIFLYFFFFILYPLFLSRVPAKWQPPILVVALIIFKIWERHYNKKREAV